MCAAVHGDWRPARRDRLPPLTTPRSRRPRPPDASTPLAEPTFIDPRGSPGANKALLRRPGGRDDEQPHRRKRGAGAGLRDAEGQISAGGARRTAVTSPQEGGRVGLIRDPNAEKRSLDGYIVLRVWLSPDSLKPLVTSPIQLTQFRDENLPAGTRYVAVCDQSRRQGRQRRAPLRTSSKKRRADGPDWKKLLNPRTW